VVAGAAGEVCRGGAGGGGRHGGRLGGAGRGGHSRGCWASGSDACRGRGAAGAGDAAVDGVCVPAGGAGGGGGGDGPRGVPPGARAAIVRTSALPGTPACGVRVRSARRRLTFADHERAVQVPEANGRVGAGPRRTFAAQSGSAEGHHVTTSTSLTEPKHQRNQ